MILENKDFEAWMKRIWDKLENLERKVAGKEKEKERQSINGDMLLDNQDLCLMLNVSKRTLQRFRSSGRLPYRKFDRKLYYLESEVLAFVKNYLNPVKRNTPEEDSG